MRNELSVSKRLEAIEMPTTEDQSLSKKILFFTTVVPDYCVSFVWQRLKILGFLCRSLDKVVHVTCGAILFFCWTVYPGFNFQKNNGREGRANEFSKQYNLAENADRYAENWIITPSYEH